VSSSGFDGHARHFGATSVAPFFWPWRPLGRPGSGCFGCISVASGVAYGGFALTARHFFQTPKKYPKRLAPTSGPSQARGPFAPGSIQAQRLRFASLHLRALCLAAPDGRCAPTPGSIPPLSLPMSLVRQDQDQEHSSWRSLCRSCRRLRSFDLAFAWERACSRMRPDSRPVS